MVMRVMTPLSPTVFRKPASFQAQIVLPESVILLVMTKMVAPVLQSARHCYKEFVKEL